MLRFCLFLCVIIVVITLCCMMYKNYTPPKTLIIYEISGKLSQQTEIPVLCIKSKVTAYNSEVCQTDDTPHIAAWNNPVYDGMVAVSRDLEELGLGRGCKVYIDGNEFVIDDRMHKRKRGQLDIWMKDRESAEKWGVQEKEVLVLDPNVIEKVVNNLGYGMLDVNLKFVG
ncbi:MAG: hypothetical protein ACFFDY_01165 [Candidatus Thorarchaeota archaeon]